MPAAEATEPRPAATVILLRDGAEQFGFELLLVKRNPEAPGCFQAGR
jgi:hypothetical protein